ncbi:MAG: S-layer homology domain-containing protein, partial [Bacteroidia bacterium]|nr:S-layer homology domain-containing protein [Bacteroidia bacterium]
MGDCFMRKKSFFCVLSLVLTLLLGSTTLVSIAFATTLNALSLPTTTTLEVPPLSPLSTVPLQPSTTLQPVATSVPLSPTASLPYTDVAEHWAKEAILAGSVRGFVQGSYGVFRPDAAITRGEMSVIVDRMMGYLVPSTSAFFDLDENFYTQPILRAHHAGVLLGDQGLVRPLDPITREEAVVMLARALGIVPSTTPTPYTDRDLIADWATPYVQALTEQGILSGREGQFDPQAPITRAEGLTILHQSVIAYYDTPGTYEGTVTGHAIVKT